MRRSEIGTQSPSFGIELLRLFTKLSNGGNTDKTPTQSHVEYRLEKAIQISNDISKGEIGCQYFQLCLMMMMVGKQLAWAYDGSICMVELSKINSRQRKHMNQLHYGRLDNFINNGKTLTMCCIAILNPYHPTATFEHRMTVFRFDNGFRIAHSFSSSELISPPHESGVDGMEFLKSVKSLAFHHEQRWTRDVNTIYTSMCQIPDEHETCIFEQFKDTLFAPVIHIQSFNIK